MDDSIRGVLAQDDFRADFSSVLELGDEEIRLLAEAGRVGDDFEWGRFFRTSNLSFEQVTGAAAVIRFLGNQAASESSSEAFVDALLNSMVEGPAKEALASRREVFAEAFRDTPEAQTARITTRALGLGLPTLESVEAVWDLRATPDPADADVTHYVPILIMQLNATQDGSESSLVMQMNLRQLEMLEREVARLKLGASALADCAAELNGRTETAQGDPQ